MFDLNSFSLTPTIRPRLINADWYRPKMAQDNTQGLQMPCSQVPKHTCYQTFQELRLKVAQEDSKLPETS